MFQPQRYTCLVSQAATNDQWNTATSADFVQQHVGFQFEFADQLVGAVSEDFAFIGVDVDDITGFHLVDITFDGQGAGIFHGVEENWRDLAAQTDTAVALVGNVGDVIADVPQHRVGS